MKINITWSFLGSSRNTEIDLEVPEGASNQAPLIILLHGTNGDISDMSDPATHPGRNYERIAPGTIVDRGWHDYPNVGFWSLGADQLADVIGWSPFLAAAGFPTINYRQTKPDDVLVEPLRELRAIFDAIDTDSGFLPVRRRRIILMGHSRGGILARMILVELAGAGAPILARIITCITLHTPNQGSTVANTALGLATIVASWRVTGVPLVPPELNDIALLVLDDLLTFVEDEAGDPAYTDFVVGSPTLVLLAAAEPVPGVRYFTFGGTRPVVLNLRGWAFTPESAVPLHHRPPFHWSSIYIPQIPLPPPGALPFPEMLEGGDLLTNSAMTRLPFGVHRDNYINHAEALWDDALKVQVIAILNRDLQPGDLDGIDPPAHNTVDISFFVPLLLSGPG